MGLWSSFCNPVIGLVQGNIFTLPQDEIRKKNSIMHDYVQQTFISTIVHSLSMHKMTTHPTDEQYRGGHSLDSTIPTLENYPLPRFRSVAANAKRQRQLITAWSLPALFGWIKDGSSTSRFTLQMTTTLSLRPGTRLEQVHSCESKPNPLSNTPYATV